MKKHHLLRLLIGMMICLGIFVTACQFSKNATVNYGSSGSASGSSEQSSATTLPENMELGPIGLTTTPSSTD